jgi:hypothetical protein
MKRENLTIVVLACLAWVLLSHTSVSIVFPALALVLAIYCRASRLDRLQVEEYVAVYDILSRGSGDTPDYRGIPRRKRASRDDSENDDKLL